MIELPILDRAETGQEKPDEKFWRSFGQLEGHPDFQHVVKDEFMPGVTDTTGTTSRRQFMQLMGASVAFAGVTACRRPVEKILPFARKPEEMVPGVPVYYATGMPLRGIVHGLLVESHEGRPTKVEGNPEHPVSQGSTSVFEQASILNLYDPDRSQDVLYNGEKATWDAFVLSVEQFSVNAETRRLAVISELYSSPTYQALRAFLKSRFPQLRWVTYTPDGDDNISLGMQQAFGQPLRPSYRFSEAEVIVSLDADFLGPTDLNTVGNTREFAASRRLDGPEDTMSRLYVVESTYSITGGMADHRLRLRAGDIPSFAAAIAARLGVGNVGDTGRAFIDHPYAVEIVTDLQRVGQRGVVLAGQTQPPTIHALCALINGVLGSIGQTMVLLDTEETTLSSQADQFAELVNDMHAGSVEALLMIGVNPVYDAPAELRFADAMERVGHTMHVGPFVDETAHLCRWHIPQSHFLEAWGDGRAFDGTLSVIQPLIAPLYQSRSEIEVLNVFASGRDRPGYDLVREQWRDVIDGDFEEGWGRVLHDGFLPNSDYVSVAPSVDTDRIEMLTVSESDALEIVFRLDPRVLDGRFTNNAWMQELPDPTTKLVWDNVALMNSSTAQRLGLKVNYSKGRFFVDTVELTVGESSVILPVWIQPGLPDRSITVTLGYGRNIQTTRSTRKSIFFDTDKYSDAYGSGPLGNGIGVNVGPLRPAGMHRVTEGIRAVKAGEDYMIATTQEHGSMEGRPLFRMASLEEYRGQPHFAEEAVHTLPGGEPWEAYPELWQDNHPSEAAPMTDNLYYKNQWGMVIDLNSCTGCNACIVACSSENNIQVAGKEEVSLGREMHWLRLDRYFVSDENTVDDAKMVIQPIMCMHCENAPCESVCPVTATVHSPDGTNQMAYNRCIGTRYCSNNCPYKVRRFNYFNLSKTMPEQVKMAQNPNVTVRFRGVMEKCSFCVQRIRESQRRGSIENRPLEDGEVKTACQQVCPAQAISFGDLNDPNSAVMEKKRNTRRYEILAELNVKPRTSYLARVRNPNPRLDQA